MKKITIYFIVCLLFSIIISCKKSTSHIEHSYSKEVKVKPSLINPNGKTIVKRFNPPKGFERIHILSGSFEEYLRTLPLKPHLSEVLYFNGATKPNNQIYNAVVDLSIGTKNLHQCADAIMRLRAEYLWKIGQYDSIHFNFTNGFRVDYSKWMKGFRINVDGNKVQWIKTNTSSNTKKDLWNYMETIFTYAGTLSLEKELHPSSFNKISIGNVLIQGGSPGHAVIVVDMAENKQTEEKVFLLAQSYMPAQEIQILQNPMDNNSPWYSNQIEGQINTPEWLFNIQDLKKF